MNNKNLPWIIGGAFLAWWLLKQKKQTAQPKTNELLAVENASSATAATFTPDYTPEEKIINEAFNNC